MTYLLNDQISFSGWVAFTSWDIGRYTYCNFCLPVCKVINFEINLSFLIKPFSYIWPKNSEQKLKYLQDENIFLGETKSIFTILK